jgi:hypothetical protein
MPYYIRVLGTQDPDIHIRELIDSLDEDGLVAKIAFDPNEQPDSWTMLDIANAQGEPLAQIERNQVIEGKLGQEELDEFKEIVVDFKPTSAATWLTKHFDKIKVIYAFQMLNAALDDGNMEIISSLKNKIWSRTSGIIQADNEGFSNEDGYHILWQFSDNVTGDWSCATLNELGEWDKFIMDLGDKVQRQEFQNGQVPKYATRLY